MKIKFFLLVFISFMGHFAQARPEYALNTTTNSCSFCHVSSFGGGARTQYGKAYGARGLGISPFSNQDYVSGDFLAIGYLPRTSTTKTSGFGVMSVGVTGNIPLTPKESLTQMRLVGSLVSPELSTGAINNYLLIEPSEKVQILVGKFNLPFGIGTDEHRTFTRMQTLSSYRNSYQGIGLAHDMGSEWHLDLAYVNDPISATLISDPAAGPTWGGVLNLRWTPIQAPVMLGYSRNHFDRPLKQDAFADSIYVGFSFLRATAYQTPVTLLAEYSEAKGWNQGNNMNVFFMGTGAAATAFETAVSNSRSQAVMAQLIWSPSEKYSLLYKYDQLIFDREYPADAFDRQGIGANFYFAGQTQLLIRYEGALRGRKDLDSTAKAAFDSVFFVVRAGF